MFQSIGFIPLAIKNSLVLEKGLLPKIHYMQKMVMDEQILEPNV